jgi:hypothetical protein
MTSSICCAMAMLLTNTALNNPTATPNEIFLMAPLLILPVGWAHQSGASSPLD